MPRSSLREEENRNYTPDDLGNYRVVLSGDLAINKMKAWQGSLGISPCDGIVSPAYYVYALKVDDRLFAHRLLRSKPYVAFYNQSSDGVRIGQWDLSRGRLKRIPVLLPPLPDQAAIVRYLDHVDRRIRKYIRAKQKLIALLNEQKQAIIHEAVTGRIDVRTGKPYPKYKPSGVPWLGDVPEHWEVRRFKSVARVSGGQVDPRDSEHRDKLLIAPNHVEKETGTLLLRETAAEQGAISGKYAVRRGQVVYCKIRPYLRKATIAVEECLCSADMYPLSIREAELRPRYFLQLILTVPFTKQAEDCSLRAAMPKVNREAIGKCWLWYPALKEQDTILGYVTEATAPADAAIAKARREVDLLREYRTRLVADVVTGKLDVREAAASLPEEGKEDVEEPELVDAGEIEGLTDEDGDVDEETED